MAEYLLRNTLSPSKVVSCSVSFRQLINKGEDGESVWLIEIRTVEPHKDGGSIPPEFIHYSNTMNLDEAIREATEKIASKINWLPLTEDVRAPFVFNYEPKSNVVDIYSKVLVDMKDILPAAGIDPNSIEVIVNGIDVTNDIELIGHPYEYRILWQPRERILDYY